MGGWFYADCLSRLCPFLHWKERSHLERLRSYGWKVATRGKPLRSSSRVRDVSHIFISLPLPHLCLSQFRAACVAGGTVLFHARASRPFLIARAMLSPFPHPHFSLLSDILSGIKLVTEIGFFSSRRFSERADMTVVDEAFLACLLVVERKRQLAVNCSVGKAVQSQQQATKRAGFD